METPLLPEEVNPTTLALELIVMTQLALPPSLICKFVFVEIVIGQVAKAVDPYSPNTPSVATAHRDLFEFFISTFDEKLMINIDSVGKTRQTRMSLNIDFD